MHGATLMGRNNTLCGARDPVSPQTIHILCIDKSSSGRKCQWNVCTQSTRVKQTKGRLQLPAIAKTKTAKSSTHAKTTSGSACACAGCTTRTSAISLTIEVLMGRAHPGRPSGLPRLIRTFCAHYYKQRDMFLLSESVLDADRSQSVVRFPCLRARSQGSRTQSGYSAYSSSAWPPLAEIRAILCPLQKRIFFA